MNTGRVSIPIPAFIEALPEAHRNVLAGDHGLTEVQLPLQEILLNLPSSALSIRADQVAEETGATYLTPFSQKADEDARRLGVGETGGPDGEPAANPPQDAVPPVAIEKPVVPESKAPAMRAEPAADPKPHEAEVQAKPAAETAPAPAAEAAPLPGSGISGPSDKPVEAVQPISQPPVRPLPKDTLLQTLFMTEDELDAKTVVKLVTQLPGINGCTVMFGDGLPLAGNFPRTGTPRDSARCRRRSTSAR